MDIEVGEYVRTKLGDIGKIIEITPNYLRKDDGFKIWLNKYDPITKHSKNIIDLIEVDDVIEFKEYDTVAIMAFSLFYNEEFENFIEKVKNNEIQIISILTHGQYEANCYRLEDKR